VIQNLDLSFTEGKASKMKKRVSISTNSFGSALSANFIRAFSGGF
jgi:hypothetical protein